MKLFGEKSRRADTIRSRRYKEKRAHRRKVLTIISSSSALVLLAAGIFFLRSDMLRVSEITVEGEGLQPEEVEKTLEPYLSGSHLLVVPKNSSPLIPKGEIEANLLESNPRLAAAAVSILDDELKISLSEREATALWCSSDAEGKPVSPCSFIDATSYAFAEAPLFSSSPYMIYTKEGVSPEIRKTIFNEDESRWTNELTALLSALSLSPDSVFVSRAGDVEVHLGANDTPLSRAKLMVAQGESIDEMKTRLESLIEGGVLTDALRDESADGFAYVDLRFGSKVFYKTGSEEPEAPTLNEESELPVEAPAEDAGTEDIVEEVVSELEDIVEGE